MPTIGELLIGEALPPGMRLEGRRLDNKGVKSLFAELAERHPDEYRHVAQRLMNVGREVATATGGFSVGLSDLRQTKGAREAIGRITARLRSLRGLPREQRRAAVLKVLEDARGTFAGDILNEADAAGNPLASQARSGTRGNAFNVASLLGADLMYTDHRGRPLPVPVLRSYSQGLRPHEYFAGAFGARKGIIDLALATQNAGYLSKQLVQIDHRLVVSDRDDPNPYDETTPRGLPADTDDPDNEGGRLAHPVAGFARNTLLTPKILKAIKAAGVDEILVRSPSVGGPADGGVYGYDVGRREDGELTPVGTWVGNAAAAAVSEPVIQGAICLAAGTLVRMADMSVRPIEAVRPDELVLGADGRGQTFPVRVLRFLDNGPRECIETVFRPGARQAGCASGRCKVSGGAVIRLTSTPAHKVLLLDGFRLATLPIGDRRARTARLASSMSGSRYARLLVRTPVGSRPTFDLEVDHPAHLFVLANGLIVSNSSKHTGGVAGATSGAVGGFQAINNMIQMPQVFPGAATHAQVDGLVERVDPAPQGGWYVHAGGKQHYVPLETPPTVKKGDTVEAGDMLSSGMPNPAEIVRHKGVGEGRRYFVRTFRDVLRASGQNAHRRNIELLARGLLNHVIVQEPTGDWLPDDVVPYQALEASWEPRQGARVLPPTQAVGKYLERPVLHYTVGTPIRPSMVAAMRRHGVGAVTTHHEAPPFAPHAIRGMEVITQDEDPMVRMLGAYQQRSMLDAVHRGRTSDEESSSYVPSLAAGTFGRTKLTRGPRIERPAGA